MNSTSILVFLGLAALLAVGVLVSMSACREVTTHQLEGTVIDMGISVRERERTVQTGCPTCPGSQLGTTTEVVREETHYIVVSVVEASETTELRITVTPSDYDALSVGDAVRIRLTRSARDGRICGQPALVR